MNAEVPVLESAPAQAAPPHKRSRPLLIVFLFLVVAAAGAGGWLYFNDHSLSGGQAAAAGERQAAPAPEGPPLFVALDPPFVVNFEAERLVRFLQVSVQVMSRDPQTVDLVKANDPIVRNDLLLLLGNQRYDVISTREGKERLRDEALETVRKVVASAGGKPEYVEAVYFTSFVMQ